MAMAAHLATLSQRHQDLDAAISTEMKHPGHDETRVHELKRLKLQIKDQIEQLRRRTSGAT